MTVTPWRIGSRAEAPQGTGAGSQGGAGLSCHWKALGRESIQEEINLVMEPSPQAGKDGLKWKQNNQEVKMSCSPSPAAEP